jgi:hypothetical protein
MNKYSAYALTFLINAAILATISSISIETRFAVDHTPNSKISSLKTFMDKIFYYLKIFPYKFAHKFGLLEKGQVPEWVKFMFTFFITFLIALFVYHLFLLLLGYNTVYKYFLGNINLYKKIKKSKN